MLIKLIYLVLLYKVNMILKYKLKSSIYKTYILSFIHIINVNLNLT